MSSILRTCLKEEIKSKVLVKASSSLLIIDFQWDQVFLFYELCGCGLVGAW